MSSISPEDYIGEIFGFTLFAIILHFYAKSFLKDKLKTKEEFEKFVAENGSSPKKGFYYKKGDMDMANVRYRGIVICTWFCVFIVLFVLCKLILNRS